MSLITDPNTLRRLNGLPPEGFKEDGAPSGAPSQGQQDPSFFQGMSKAPSHAWESIKSGYFASAKEAAEDLGYPEDVTTYGKKRYETAKKNRLDLESEMGTGAQLGSGVIQGLATAAPMVLTRGVPGAVATGVMSYGQNLGEMLVQQDLAGQEMDRDKARGYAANAAIADTALGMLPTSAVKGAFGKVGADAAVGAASGYQQTVNENLAVGRDWNENTGMGAFMGGMAGGGVSGISQAAGAKWNQAGKDAVQKMRNFTNGKSINKNFQEDYVEYINYGKDLEEQIKNTPVGSDEYNQLITARENFSKKGADTVGVVDATELYEKFGVPVDKGNYNYQTFDMETGQSNGNVADNMGFGSAEAQKANDITAKARAGTLTKGGIDKGLTADSFYKDFQAKAKNALQTTIGTVDTNVSTIKGKMDEMVAADREYRDSQGTRGEPMNDGYYDDLKLAHSALLDISKNYHLYKAPNVKYDVAKMQRASRDVMRYLDRTGLRDEMIDVFGNKGSFDPIRGLYAIEHMQHMAVSKMDNFFMGRANVTGESIKSDFTMGDLGWTFATNGGYLAAKALGKGLDPIRQKMSQNALKKQIEGGSPISGLAKNLNEVARTKREAAAVKAQADITKAQNDVAVAEAKAAETEAKLAEEEAKAAEEARAEAADAKAKTESGARVKPTVDALKRGDSAGAAQAAEQGLADVGVPIPEPQPSIFDSEVNLSGNVTNPSQNLSDTVKLEQEIQHAKEKADRDAQAAQAAQQRANDLRVMARQRQVAEEGTVHPDRIDDDPIEVVEAQQQADLAAQQAEQSAREADMIATKNKANIDFVSQQNSVQRGAADRASKIEEEKRLAAEEAETAEAERLSAEATAKQVETSDFVKTPTAQKAGDEVVTPDDQLSDEGLLAEVVAEPINTPTPEQIDDDVLDAFMTDKFGPDWREKLEGKSSKDSTPIPIPKKKSEPEVEPEIVVPGKDSEGMQGQPMPEPKTPEKAPEPVKEVSDTSAKVEEDKPAESVSKAKEPVIDGTKAYELVEAGMKKEISDLNKKSTKNFTASDARKVRMLETKHLKLTTARNNFLQINKDKYPQSDIDQVFSELTDDEIRGRLNSTFIRSKIKDLQANQSKKASEILNSVEVSKVEKPVVDKTISAQEKLDSEWKAVDDFANHFGFSKDELNAALSSMKLIHGKSKGVKPEAVMKKIQELIDKSETLPIESPKIFNSRGDVIDIIKGYNNRFDDNSKLTDDELARAYELVLGSKGDKPQATEAEVQKVIVKFYEALAAKKSSQEKDAIKAAKKAEDEAKADRSAVKAAQDQESRKAAMALREASEKRLQEAHNLRVKIQNDKKDALAAAQAAEKEAESAKARSIAAQKAADTRAKKKQQREALEKLESEIKGVRDHMEKLGASKEQIDNYIYENFTNPKAKDASKWLEEQANARVEDFNNNVETVKEKVLEAIEKAPSNTYNTNIFINNVMDGKAKFIRNNDSKGSAIINKLGALKAAKEAGNFEDDKSKKLNDVLIKAYEYAGIQKRKHPDNPELWLSRDIIDDIFEAVNGEGSFVAYSGKIGPKLRADVFGDTGRRDLKSLEAIKEMEEKIDEVASRVDEEAADAERNTPDFGLDDGSITAR